MAEARINIGKIMTEAKEDLLKIEKMQNKYATQDNRGTAFPIYVTVQELQFACIFDNSYGHNREGEIKFHYNYEDSDCDWFDSKDDCAKHVEEAGDSENVDSMINSIDEYPCLYLWTDVEFFLTIKAAEEFIKSNAHNMGRTRTYVKHFHRRNFEMRELLNLTGFRTKD